MYIAWKKKPYEHTTMLQAEVRTSHRDSSTGRPVSCFVKYLGSIRTDHLTHPVFSQRFLEKAFQKIELLDIEECKKNRFREQLRERIPAINFSMPSLPSFIKRVLRRGRKKFHSAGLSI